VKNSINLFLKILLIGTILWLGGCGKSDEAASVDGEITVTFWHSFVSSTVPALKKLIARFENENPGIKIKAQYIPTGDALIQKLITSVQSKTAPDISWIHADYLPDLVEAQAIYKMSHFIEGHNGLSQAELDDIYPALITYASSRDTLYSMPMEATNLALIYNKGMFRDAGLDPEKPPKTWEEMYDVAVKLTKDLNGNGRNDQAGMFIPIYPAAGPMGGWMTWQWLPYLWQAGGSVVEEDQSKVLFNSDAGVAALTHWQRIYQELELNNFTTDWDIAFASGLVGMAMDGPWNLPRFKKFMANVEWSFAPLPAGPAGDATIAGCEYLTIFKQSKHPDEAWQFLKWIIQPEIQSFWAMESGYLPIRKSSSENEEFKLYLDEHPQFKVFVDAMDDAQAQRSIDQNALRISQLLAEAIEAATLGGEDPRQVLDIAAKKANKLLERSDY